MKLNDALHAAFLAVLFAIPASSLTTRSSGGQPSSDPGCMRGVMSHPAQLGVCCPAGCDCVDHFCSAEKPECCPSFVANHSCVSGWPAHDCHPSCNTASAPCTMTAVEVAPTAQWTGGSRCGEVLTDYKAGMKAIDSSLE
uniref:Granulins domain-containing protein n=1 Tax=Noctiluca scintillans TaxID=2966 RepID=A0A7S1ATG3_NOCSC|mmetsp:Transcript_59220/g.157639  ORF Transcript_59220/g.157639 Transcript_59220/m.157639 type:complete len:140 (+) Transcript_59220:122-541(+)